MPKNLEKSIQANNGFAAKLLDIFIITNLAFLALDVYIAHSINAFDHSAEWVPFYFSLFASILLVPTVLTRKKRWKHWFRFGIGWGAIGVGIGGMLFHLNSHFFSELTLKSLVYAAPFVAPLAFTGVGLLLIMNGLILDTEFEWSQWVLFLAGLGWCGNFLLSVLDHAQNGFFNITEWLPVWTSAMALGCLATLFIFPYKPSFLKFCVVVLGVNIIVGFAGFLLHFTADLHAPGMKITDRFIYGAPLFAPLLFPNLSLLALLGIWRLPSSTSVL